MKHLAEVDGLRAVAVIAVLLYHAGIAAAGGGFIGVDVFFVISGYLITRLLLDDLHRGSFSLADFFKRRVLRIAPALFVMLAASAVVFFVLFPPALSKGLLASLTSALFSYSNLWFYQTVDYFSANDTNPVLHTWSLALEEQFYLVLPLFLLGLRAAGLFRFTTPAVMVLLALSLAASSVIVADSQAMAFYLPFLRAWELLAGSLLASVRLERLPLRVRGILSNLGLALIVAGAALYTDKISFPGVTALLPVVGAAAVISGQGSRSIANRLLMMRFMRWTGALSYSLYLVHWPLLCAASLLLTLYPDKVKAAAVLASFVLAWLSWRFIETPFRRMAAQVSARKVLSFFALACIGMALLFRMLDSANAALWDRYPVARKYSEWLEADMSYFRTGTCFLTPKYDGVRYFRFDECLRQHGGKDNVLVMGDSHAANIVTGLAERFTSLNFLQATASGCRPTVDTAGAARCVDLIRHMYREWLPQQGAGVRYVVLAGRWEAQDMEPLRRTVSYLKSLGKQVILYGPSPEYMVVVPLMLAYESMFSADLQSRFVRRERFALDATFAKEFSGEVSYFSPVNGLCRDGRCEVLAEDTPLFVDRDHFSPVGVRRMIREFPLPS